MHIAIGGNIGSGKTTLAEMLSEHYGWTAHYEDVETNFYLNDFYEDMLRWSFNLQIFFLQSRFNQVIELRKTGKQTIQDRTIYEDAFIFAPNLKDMGLLSVRDFDCYKSLFDMMSSLIQPPDLMIYLRASVPTLVKQIKKRGREYESGISIDYLARLNERYEAWISNYELGKLLIIDVDPIDFSENAADLKFVIDTVDKELQGCF